MNDIIIRKAKKVEEYLYNNYEGYVELCGRNDEANTLPAKRALDDAKDILSYLESDG